MKATPKINYADQHWFPDINVREWNAHTHKMILVEWMPLTYFVAIGILSLEGSRTDPNGCSLYASKQIEKLMIYVFCPIIVMRLFGTVLLNKPNLIIYQLFMIYTYMIVSLSIWEV